MIKARLTDTLEDIKEVKAQITETTTTIIDAVVGNNLQVEAAKALAAFDSHQKQGMHELVLYFIFTYISHILHRNSSFSFSSFPLLPLIQPNCTIQN
jgi:hypothetical protein